MLLILVFYMLIMGSSFMHFTRNRREMNLKAISDCDILQRVLKGERATRTPVWLMRQFSLETPDIAVELSLQPWEAFGVDGVIMFSDIMTPLTMLGIDFSIVPGKGPVIKNPIRSETDIKRIAKIKYSPDVQLPFIRTILQTLSKELSGRSTLIGFIGAPWTLAGYCVENDESSNYDVGENKLCAVFKHMCMDSPQHVHMLLRAITDMLKEYSAYQIGCGAQVIQIFESWAHYMSESEYKKFALPYVNDIVNHLRLNHPDVPVIYFANGGSRFLKDQIDIVNATAFSLDWHIAMKDARGIAGPQAILCGNLNPRVLFDDTSTINKEVKECIESAGYTRHVFNLGDGIVKTTEEESVRQLVDAVKSIAHPVI